ncbi:MAG: hypothetical protein HC786_02110 [Richelia sp. CSU_2_1]|nr:hypothetical protein [Richelia sp. CSU_2_1]
MQKPRPRRCLGYILLNNLSITNSQFPITNSQFPIPNYQLPIPNSQFPIPNSQSVPHRSAPKAIYILWQSVRSG